MTKKLSILKYIFYGAELLIFFILQSTPKLLPEIFGAKPVLLFCVALTVAAFETEIPAMLLGLSAGALIDISSGGNIGYYAFFLTLVSFVAVRLFKLVMVKNLINVVIMSFVITTVLFTIYFCVFVLPMDMQNGFYYYVNHYISRIIQTVILTIPVFYLNKFIHNITAN